MKPNILGYLLVVGQRYAFAQPTTEGWGLSRKILMSRPHAVWTLSESRWMGGRTDWDAALERNWFSRPMSAAVNPSTSPASFAPTINIPPPELENATNSATSESTLLMLVQ